MTARLQAEIYIGAESICQHCTITDEVAKNVRRDRATERKVAREASFSKVAREASSIDR
eukprot:COSAG05_NODE_1738_length_4162_cov_10.776028_5_plen_59_part_00